MHGDGVPRPGTKPAQTPIHALCLCQTMMSSQGHPSKHAKDAPGKPFSSRCHRSVRPGPAAEATETCDPRSRAVFLEILVEPDGIEPTTSCLQSTRSTN